MKPPGAPFLILALPRSRTAWLARFLSYGGYEAAHDHCRHLRSVEDVRSWLGQDFTGACETGAAPWWRLVHHIRPDVRTLVIRRPVDEVVASVLAVAARDSCTVDRPALESLMRRHDRKLDQAERRLPGVLSVGFADLSREDVCARLFEHCTGYAHDPVWWGVWHPINVQASFAAHVRYAAAHGQQMERVTAEARQYSIRLLNRGRRTLDLDGVVIAEERLSTFLPDAQRLIAEHATEAGPREGVRLDPDWSLIERLEEVGALQLVVGRCNGRVAGYLATVIGPSPEERGTTVATQTVFYVSADFRGLGPRMQRASVEMLRERGVGELILRAGTRASGPKAGGLYRRIGAVEHGEMFTLNLRAA